MTTQIFSTKNAAWEAWLKAFPQPVTDASMLKMLRVAFEAGYDACIEDMKEAAQRFKDIGPRE